MNNYQNSIKDILNKIDKKLFLNHPKEIIHQQLNKLFNGANHIELYKPAKIGDGLIKIDESQEKYLFEIYDKARLAGRIYKFIPASGAASRMFAKLHQALNKYSEFLNNKNFSVADSESERQYLNHIINNLNQFAFYDDLISICKKNNLNIDNLIINDPIQILKLIISPEGLNYNNKPKALLKFHKYPNHSRTAFIEHLMESALYQPDFNNKISIHFTISEEHFNLFEEEEKFAKSFEKLSEYNFDISYSYQKKSTDSITLTEENELFLNEEEKPLFRPAGHGALLENLNKLNADIIFIKNIDNVCVDTLKQITVRYKKLLAGFLLMLQKQIFEYLSLLDKKQDDEKVRKEIITFSEKLLNIIKPEGFLLWDAEKQRQFLFRKLNRPIRVCGVVKNQDEPGGAPFWVRDKNGNINLQIVEQSQINFANEEQKLIFNNSSHFNPVDIVAGVRDFKGRNFNLLEYRDEDSFMIVHKIFGSHKIKFLELPGLWNGGMADWISVFVEVPLETFNPVKELTDLLKKGHIEN